MGFLEKIVEKENAFLNKVQQIEKKLPLYIFGAASGGENVALLLEKHGVHFDGFVVNKRYYENAPACDRWGGVLCLEDVLESADKINLIVAFKGFDESLLVSQKIENLLNYDCFHGLASMGGTSNFMPYSWLLEHEAELQRTYDLLQDELSRKCFVAFINQKVSMKYGYLTQVKTQHQYFDEKLVHFTDKEVFVDCGGYDGDTAQAFREALKRQGISTYKKIISFEPDPKQFKKMQELGLERHHCVQKGVSDKEGVLYFSSASTSGRIKDNGDIKIEVDTIDHVCEDSDVTMIKMDIEGSELSALHGAENVIKRCHPLLAICVYHKKEDLYEIPQYIKKLHSGYKLYLRQYKDASHELVLYAVPDNRAGEGKGE